MSTFDADSFLNQTVETSLDTKRLVIPADKYQAQIDKITTRDGIISKGDNAGKPWVSLNVMWSIMDEGLKQEFDRSKIVVPQNIFLDLDDNGGLASGKGKNVNLGKLRDAVGQNEDGQPWSPNMLLGQVAEINVTVGVNPKTQDEQNEVSGVAPYEG